MPGKYAIPPIKTQVLYSEPLRDLPQVTWEVGCYIYMETRPDPVGKSVG